MCIEVCVCDTRCLLNVAGPGLGLLLRDAVVAAAESVLEAAAVVDDEAANVLDAFSCTLGRNTTETVQKLS